MHEHQTRQAILRWSTVAVMAIALASSVASYGDQVDGQFSEIEPIASALPGTTTPPPTANWSSSGPGNQDLSADSGFPADAQVAASQSHVVVTQRASIGFFTRQGTQLQHTNGETFFSGLLPVNPHPQGVFDLRTIYDRFRNRFWIVGMVNSTPFGNGRLLIGVSQTDNPLLGWFTYWWNGQVPNATGGIDYPSIGISVDALMIANDGGAGTILRVFPADQMAAGVPADRLTGFWAWWNLTNGDGSAVGILQPAMHHDGTAAGRHYAISRYGARGVTIFSITDPLSSNRAITKKSLLLPRDFRNAFAAGAPNGAPQAGTTWRVGMYLNDGVTLTQPLKAVARDNRLYFVAPDADFCGTQNLFAAIRLIRLDVTNFPTVPTSGPVFINRTFGCANVADPAGTLFHYGWPALEVNDFGDMGIVYMRTGATIFPEVRFSAYGATDSDIRPSRLLFAGPAPYSSASCGQWCDAMGMGQLDTAGASVDPSDGESIWIAQMVPDPPRAQGFSIRVGKVFGAPVCVHDLCTEGVDLTASCDTCVGNICARDPFCCEVGWDRLCVSEVGSVCGHTCP